MRLQHPDKTQHEVAPAGVPSFLTDERGIVDLDEAVEDRSRAAEIRRSLMDQGWTRTDKPKTQRASKKAAAAEETDASPDAEDTPEDADALGEEA